MLLKQEELNLNLIRSPFEGPQLDWKFARRTCKSHSITRDRFLSKLPRWINSYHVWLALCCYIVSFGVLWRWGYLLKRLTSLLEGLLDVGLLLLLMILCYIGQEMRGAKHCDEAFVVAEKPNVGRFYL